MPAAAVFDAVNCECMNAVALAGMLVVDDQKCCTGTGIAGGTAGTGNHNCIDLCMHCCMDQSRLHSLCYLAMAAVVLVVAVET